MSTRRKFLTSRTVPLGTAAAVLLLGVAACGSPAPSATTSPSPTPSESSATPSVTPSASETMSPPATTATPAPPTACSTASLSASLDTSGGGAAGSVYGTLRLKNTGAADCVLNGFATVELAATAGGPAIGAQSQTQGAAGPAITLAPGASAGAILRYSQAGLHPDCTPVAATLYRVYAPGNSNALTIPVSEDGCSNAAVNLLTIQAFVAGA
ncbi:MULTISPECIES: DUF4232 domain-containing protein [Arthrobacter]|uniref:DUF4232 domain-containing protein n=2 Tax=Arthrobacter TaxID=1663 RepID=A0ABU9KHK0_9MICC|nr:DUF4232 domain-containing protein [Arthrobacter sp. YJM1]MDP5226605.1 DUF4232 domain-containing protein [Arthrobacter sp. YJM1]